MKRNDALKRAVTRKNASLLTGEENHQPFNLFIAHSSNCSSDISAVGGTV
jgi:hypothetical protein